MSFQFIGFPSEWGAPESTPLTLTLDARFQFIGFPSEWGDDNFSEVNEVIMFPIYWVPQRVGSELLPT